VNLAQDFQLSQYDANPLYINPALTGMRLNDGWDYRLSMNYRDQKGNTGKSNKTFANGFDMPFTNRFSFGEFIINNNSINNSLNTFNFMLSAAYRITHKNEERYNKHNLSVGLQAGLLQQSFNQNNYNFDSQYSSSSLSGFDANIPNGENFTKTNTFNFDANIGMFYKFIDKNKKYSPFGGFSFYHLTRPDQSYSSAYSQIPLRFSLQGGCTYTINETFSLLPQFLFMEQAGVKNINVGIMGYEKIRCTDYQLMLGTSWRNTDAVIIHAGLKYRGYAFRVSYDVVTNYMKQFGNRGIEVSLVLTFQKKVEKPDLVATLVINHDTSIHRPPTVKLPLLKLKDSVNNLTPILKDSSAILTDSSKSVLPPVKKKDKVNSVIIPLPPIFLDSSAIIINSSKPSLPSIKKDTVKTIYPKKKIQKDSSAILLNSSKPSLLPIKKDTVKTIYPKNKIQKDSSAIIINSSKSALSSIKKDTAKIVHPKNTIPKDSSAGWFHPQKMEMKKKDSTVSNIRLRNLYSNDYETEINSEKAVPVVKNDSGQATRPSNPISTDSSTIKKDIHKNQPKLKNLTETNVKESDSLSHETETTIKFKKKSVTAKPELINIKPPEKIVQSDSTNQQKTVLPIVVSDSLINAKAERMLLKDSTYRYNWFKLLYYQLHLGKRAKVNKNVNDTIK
jgi:type IX secretion system PorP/SprF family membrane protein